MLLVAIFVYNLHCGAVTHTRAQTSECQTENE